jgi:predicted aldo/keto reductase-like oxidoreductase
MEYRDIGKTGKKASILGFGAMRLPMTGTGSNKTVCEDESVKMILRAFELGVNIIDTAYPYCSNQSEKTVGKALNAWKKILAESNHAKSVPGNGIVYLSTKFPTWLAGKKDDFRIFLEEQINSLDGNHIDFYHLHTLNEEYFTEKVLKLGLLDEALKAKEEGLISHLAFSFHDSPDVMKKIIDTLAFEVVLCQYNILDRVNEEAICYAVEKGLGVFVMGPLGGGRIKDTGYFRGKLAGSVSKIHELAFKFVFSNPNISVAFSGMESLDMVEENLAIANSYENFTDAERKIITKFIDAKKVAELIPCTNCQYCMPCPAGVAIPGILKIYNYYMLTSLQGNCAWQYQNISQDGAGRQADSCTECGQCEEKCPQKIGITGKLKEAHRILAP